MVKVRRFAAVAFAALLCGGAWAQRTEVEVRETQARVVDGYARAYVKPLTVELEIMKVNGAWARVEKTYRLSKAELDGMGGNSVNIRSYVVYLAARDSKADAIVAPTFFLENDKENPGYFKVEVRGFAARFVNWKSATAADYEWMRMEKTQTTDDRDNLRAVIKK